MPRHAPLPSPSSPRLRRRVVLGSLGAVALLAGACDAARSPGAGPGSVATTAPAEDADTELVERTGQRIADTSALVVAAGRGRPALRPTTRAWARLHSAHLDELGWSGTAAPAPSGSAGSVTVARAEILAAEAALQQTLLAATQEARSGGLARLLASMAAAGAQLREQT